MTKRPFTHPDIIQSSEDTLAMIEKRSARQEIADLSRRAEELEHIIDRRLNHVHQGDSYPSLTCFVLGTLLPGGAGEYRIGWVKAADLKEGLYKNGAAPKKTAAQRIFGSSTVYSDDEVAEAAAREALKERPECTMGLKIIHTAQPWPS